MIVLLTKYDSDDQMKS